MQMVYIDKMWCSCTWLIKHHAMKKYGEVEV
jgi:hypothetical protein